jgi:hypothetical protein
MEHLFIATSGNTCTFMILQEGSNFGAPARWRRAPSEDEQEELDWHVAKVLQRRLAQMENLLVQCNPSRRPTV